jgi:hypothetical protein
MALHVYKSCRGLTMKNRRNVRWVEEKGEKRSEWGQGGGTMCVPAGDYQPRKQCPCAPVSAAAGSHSGYARVEKDGCGQEGALCLVSAAAGAAIRR